jgi:hypothetical protein
VAAKGVGEVGDGPGPHTCMDLACLTPVLVCIAFSLYIVAVVCLIHILCLIHALCTLSEADNQEEGIEKIFDKSLKRVNDKF